MKFQIKRAVRKNSSVLRALFLVGTLALVIAGCETPESSFPKLTNNARAAVGKGALSTNPPGGTNLYNKAKAHADEMCRRGKIGHTTDFYNTTLVKYYNPASNWKALGENVGVIGWNANDQNTWTASTNALFQAFMDSPGHKANILGDYNYQVVAQSVCGNGNIYVTHFFAKF
ncbi:MAG: CAP domain-containing protein [Polyangiales bacterium]